MASAQSGASERERAVYDAPPLMKRRLPQLVLLIGAVLIAIAVWPKREASPLLPAAIASYEFANQLPEIHPPLDALQPTVLADPVLRTAARIDWGPPGVFYWTARHLPPDRDALAARLMERYEKIVVGSPYLAQRLIDALAVVGHESAIPMLMRVARYAPPEHEHLQIAAIRALAKFPRSSEAEELLIALSSDPRRAVAGAALQEIVHSEDFGDVDAMNSFLLQWDGGEAIPFLQQVGHRRLAGCCDAVLRHLDSPAQLVRQNAIFALLANGDLRGRVAALAELASGDERRIIEGLTLWRDAQQLLPLDEARKLLDHPLGEVRKQLAIAIGAGAGSSPDEAVDALLARLAADSDPVVGRAAADALFRRGRAEAIESWRATLANGRGMALREAVSFLCDGLRDPAAPPILRRRLDGEALDGTDQGNLLSGLKGDADPSDAPRFLSRILRAGTPEDPRSGERLRLSDLAATHVQQLGSAAGTAIAAALADAPTLRAKLALLDALRGALKGMGGDDREICAERLYAIVRDEEAEVELRLAAADTVAYFDEMRFGQRLYEIGTQVQSKPVGERTLLLFATFF